MAKLDELVYGVEGDVCLGEFNGEKGCDIICGGCRVRPLTGEA